MSTSLSASLNFIASYLSIYVGIPILVSGVIGNFLNIIVFLSLRTFRKSSCVFYLTIMSAVNISQLITGLLARIMITGFGIDWTLSSLFFCKLRYFLFPASSLISFTCILLATIDQYMATCSRSRWQNLCNIKLAQRLSLFFVIVWLLHGIPYLILFDHVVSPDTGTVTCVATNTFFTQYRTYGVSLIMTGFLPVVLTTIFGILAYYNVRTINYRTVPLVRRELDKQLTVMVLTQVMVNFLTALPFSTMTAVLLNPQFMQDPTTAVILRFTMTIAILINYIYFAVSPGILLLPSHFVASADIFQSPFYIYICAAERFRRQTIHVLFGIHFNRFRQGKFINNQIKPEDQPTEY